MFNLISAWINGWVNNREACDLRRHRAHYDVIVIWDARVRTLVTPEEDNNSTLAQVMAWCLTAPSHYLKQPWLSMQSKLNENITTKLFSVKKVWFKCANKGVHLTHVLECTGLILWVFLLAWPVKHFFKSALMRISSLSPSYRGVYTCQWRLHTWVLDHGECTVLYTILIVNTSKPDQNFQHFADDIFNAFSWMRNRIFQFIFH